MSIIELIEMFMDMPETMEGLKSEGEFVVLDDDKEEHLDDEVLYSICDHLVFVNYKVGLQQSDCEKAKSMLKVN